jgi:hypothetical protein
MTSTAPIDLRGSTKEIEDSYIGGGSRGSYLNTLVQLIIFLYDSPRKELLFSAANLLKLQEAHAKDEPPPAESSGMDVEGPATAPTTKKKDDKRHHLRVSVKAILDKLGEANHRPILLESLSYEDLSSFMNTKCKKVMVNKDLAHAWSISKGVTRNVKNKRKVRVPRRSSRAARSPTNNISEDADEMVEQDDASGDEADGKTEPCTTETEKVEVLIPLSMSTYTNIRSSVAFLYRECKVPMPQDMTNSLSKYMKGTKRMSRKMKQTLSLKISEGKKVMTREVYYFISRLFMESSRKEHVFSHVFFCIDW